MDSLVSLVSSCLCHKTFFQSCHSSLKAASHGPIPKCSLVLGDLLRPVPRTATALSEAPGDSFLEPVPDCHSQGAPVDILRGQSMNIKTSCSYYNKNQQSQRQHNSHAYSACHHLTEMLKISRADGPQLCQETRN